MRSFLSSGSQNNLLFQLVLLKHFMRATTLSVRPPVPLRSLMRNAHLSSLESAGVVYRCPPCLPARPSPSTGRRLRDACGGRTYHLRQAQVCPRRCNRAYQRHTTRTTRRQISTYRPEEGLLAHVELPRAAHRKAVRRQPEGMSIIAMTRNRFLTRWIVSNATQPGAGGRLPWRYYPQIWRAKRLTHRRLLLTTRRRAKPIACAIPPTQPRLYTLPFSIPPSRTAHVPHLKTAA